MFVESIHSWIGSKRPRAQERTSRRSRKARRRLFVELLEPRQMFAAAPVIVVPGPQSVTAGGSLTLADWLGNQAWVSDPDGDSVQMTLAVSNGSLALSTSAGLTLLNDSSSRFLHFWGTLSAVDLALNDLVYTPDAGFVGNDSLQITATELDAAGLFASSSVAIGVAAPAPGASFRIFSGGGVPVILDTGAGAAVELGTRFYSDVNGLISGLRFYKSPGDTGPHTVSLWSSSGALLARATSTSETASGWQQVNFATPVAITAGTTYVASYRTTTGHFAMSLNYFGTPLTNGVLHVPVGGGVYLYGASAMPTQSYQNSNYWVDAVLESTPLAVTSFSVANGATNVATGAALAITFNQPLDPATVNASNLRLMSGSTVLSASVSYDANTRTATLTPSVALANSQSYTLVAVGGASGLRDLAGNRLAQTATSSFTTAAPSTSVSLFSGGGVPVILDTGAGAAVELGTRFY
ncbi:MAG: DUF4082 domain-containing protein, partial [Pirellulales bacterium]|nr:DUF4082 domain-containing protein [Pirellulales bacterium]